MEPKIPLVLLELKGFELPIVEESVVVPKLYISD